MGKVIAFSNQKGGSGKSTLSANIAVLWSNSGYKVAVIDADPQKSLSYWLTERKKYYGEDDIGIDFYHFGLDFFIFICDFALPHETHFIILNIQISYIQFY